MTIWKKFVVDIHNITTTNPTIASVAELENTVTNFTEIIQTISFRLIGHKTIIGPIPTEPTTHKYTN